MKVSAMTDTAEVRFDVSALRVGDELPTVSRVVSTRQLVQYAAVSRDFTPIHYDQDYAKSANLDGVVVHGALKSSLFAQTLREWFGDKGRVTALSASYRAVDYPGETLTINGRVASRDMDGNGSVRLGIELELRNAAGDVTTPGRATVILD